VPATDGCDLGVLGAMVLLLESGRIPEVDCRFCTCERGCFFVEEGSRAMEDLLVGVADVLAMAALTLRGAVMEPGNF
jgi:hypothetical protein